MRPSHHIDITIGISNTKGFQDEADVMRLSRPTKFTNQPGSLAARGWCICEAWAGENVVNYLEPAKPKQMR